MAKIVDAEFVKSHIGKLPIVDARPASMYAEGHIPTAIDISVIDFDQYGSQEAEKLAQAYQAQGLTKPDEMIIYCQLGKHAQQSCDLLESAGYEDLDLYSGSFIDWSSNPDDPIEK